MTDQKHPQDQIEVGENLRRSVKRAITTAPRMKGGKMISAETGTTFYFSSLLLSVVDVKTPGG